MDVVEGLSASLGRGGDRSVVLAFIEELGATYGPRAVRLTNLLDDLALSPDHLSDDDRSWLASVSRKVKSRIPIWREELASLALQDIKVVLRDDEDFPSNLLMIHDRPPALFVRGLPVPTDQLAIAVVGTRKPSKQGIKDAEMITSHLVERGITVVSGLAKGIDTVAHATALKQGGRTLAVIGTGIDTVYPAQNRQLAFKILEQGAWFSQFLPGQRIGRWCFPARNITLSGLAVGTVVVEAGESSGSRIQAKAALAHGKRLFLTPSVADQPWAKDLTSNPLTIIIQEAGDVTKAADQDLEIPEGILVDVE